MSSDRERPLRMSAEHSVLVLIDYQTRLMPAIYDRDRVTRRAEAVAAPGARPTLPASGPPTLIVSPLRTSRSPLIVSRPI